MAAFNSVNNLGVSRKRDFRRTENMVGLFLNAQVKIREEQLDGGNIVLYIIKEFLKAEKCLSHLIALKGNEIICEEIAVFLQLVIIDFQGDILYLRKRVIAKRMLALHTEKTPFLQRVGLFIGQIDFIKGSDRAPIGKKKSIQGTSLLRGILLITLQKTAEFIQGELAFKQNNLIAVLFKIFKGVVAFIGYFKKIRKAVADILRVLAELFINDNLINVGVKIHFLHFPGRQKRGFGGIIGPGYDFMEDHILGFIFKKLYIFGGGVLFFQALLYFGDRL